MKAAMIPVSGTNWHNPDWKKLLSSSISKPAELLERLNLTAEQMGDGKATELFKLRVPLPFVERMEKGNPKDPLLLQVWPHPEEYHQQPGFTFDPLAEKHSNPVPGLLHKYGKRVLTITAASCAINCRYCFRRHFPYDEQSYGQKTWQQWFDYIASNPHINEVILSGGEPLLTSDSQLAELVEGLSQFNHIKRLRIHTRLPVVIPQRITQSLTALAANSPFTWLMVLHINHPNEIDDALIRAAAQCHQAGIRLYNQSVLLKDINDDVVILAELSEKLFDAHIQPYYLHLLDKVTGVHHFEVSEPKAQQLYQEMLAQLPGFLVPKLVREIAGEASKTPFV
ncbi:EF-P beta-lysylation protein EpmB [Pleionea sp. CnH1-48]|uniref:EF-P beta-lysylation protein EpmB n=1 Tax=Pleionea sp. CnH1-48 TaxID=2954494 RepID=UPI0020973E6A|nr:EF-P beta-lysylation protein EpmB [Pleionea sp. CnH1-48]MCO7227423.1 EF-P beta-lysylation protein EpmB [Pleionea sp. CnH1-48]